MILNTRKHQIVAAFICLSLLGAGLWIKSLRSPESSGLAESLSLTGADMAAKVAAPQAALMDTMIAMESRAVGGAGGMAAQGGAFSAGPTQLMQPQIIQNATLSMTVDKLPDTMDRLEALTRQYQGVITNQSVSVVNPEATQRAGSFEVRVPGARLQAFLDELDALGVVLSQNLRGSDVGAQLVDFEARVRNLKSQEAALQQIMQRSGKMADVLQVANELGRVRGEIEQYQAQLGHLRQQVAYATVSLSLREAAVMNASQSRPTLITAMANAARQAMAALYDVVLKGSEAAVWAVVFLVPLLALPVGLLLVLLWPLRRWMGRPNV